MAGSIVSKLLHAPSARLRQAVCDGGAGEAIVAAAVEIFDLGRDPQPIRTSNAA
jgi:glutamyl-tRNA reductase